MDLQFPNYSQQTLLFNVSINELHFVPLVPPTAVTELNVDTESNL